MHRQHAIIQLGMNNVVLKITFSDGIIWIARTCHSPELGVDGDGKDRKTRNSDDPATISVPDVFAFETSTSNEFGYPYMLTKCLEGQMLGSTAARHVPVEYHSHVAGQLADVLF